MIITTGYIYLHTSMHTYGRTFISDLFNHCTVFAQLNIPLCFLYISVKMSFLLSALLDYKLRVCNQVMNRPSSPLLTHTRLSINLCNLVLQWNLGEKKNRSMIKILVFQLVQGISAFLYRSFQLCQIVTKHEPAVG